MAYKRPEDYTPFDQPWEREPFRPEFTTPQWLRLGDTSKQKTWPGNRPTDAQPLPSIPRSGFIIAGEAAARSAEGILNAMLQKRWTQPLDEFSPDRQFTRWEYEVAQSLARIRSYRQTGTSHGNPRAIKEEELSLEAKLLALIGNREMKIRNLAESIAEPIIKYEEFMQGLASLKDDGARRSPTYDSTTGAYSGDVKSRSTKADWSENKSTASSVGGFSTYLIIAALVAIVLFVLVGRYNAQEKDRQWAIVRANNAAAERQRMLDPRYRKMQHDLWLHGHAYRKWEKEHIPGVVLGPEPPEPPK